MCRWIGWYGNPIAPAALLYDPERSLIEQSRTHAPGMGTANGDGFGLGWYGDGTDEEPALYHGTLPAWGDRNLREIARAVRSPLFLAHVRASTGTPVQETNCHPFRYGRWVFVHNGFVAEYERVRRELLLALRPEHFDNVQGTTDSELMFHLALTHGLEDDPLGGLERMAGHVEAAGRALGIAEPLQMTVGLSDGQHLYAARYASGPVVNTLHVSADAASIRALYPERERLQRFSDEARAVVSEPLIDLPGMWHEVPPGTALVIGEGPDEQRPFAPQPPP